MVAMRIVMNRNMRRPNHAYTVCSGNRFRSSNDQKVDLSWTCVCEYPESQSDDGIDILKNSRIYKKMAIRSKTIGITNEDKHFGKPIIPFVVPNIQTINISNYVEDKVLSGILQKAQRKCYMTSLKSESHKNVEVQTDYRESETQTEPWEPPYKIVRGHNPEVLTLAHLTWKHGLPAGVHEVNVINRMRMKKAWETVLPPMDTPANIKRRNSIITALEIDEWAFRESEIQFIMDLRLKLMRNFLQSRESKHKKKVQDRFARLQRRLGKRRDDQVKTIQHNLERNLRKLCTKYRNKQHPCKSDIIERHVDSKPDLYALQMHFGKPSSQQHEAMQKESLNKDFVERKDVTLNCLPTIGKSKVIKPKSLEICIRETRWTEEKLEQLHSDLKAIRINVKSTDAIPKLMKRTFKQPVLPVTPRKLGVWNSKQKQREKSATFIQKLVRGRAIQCLMYEGRNRCRELIEELQSTQALDQQGEQEYHDKKIRMIELQQLQNDQSRQEDRLCEILNFLEGKTVSGTLDFLSKELVRLEGERKAHAFALLAERKRCMREAAEAGRRQLERNRRREFDEMFKQIVKVNQDSVEAYLEDIIKEGIDWMSDKTAKEHILELCDKMDAISKDASESTDELAEKELVADKIHNFVLPEVEKHDIRRKIRDQQESCMRNAHISIYETILDLPSVESSQSSSAVQEVCIKNEDMQTTSVNDMERVIKSEVEFSTHETGITK